MRSRMTYSVVPALILVSALACGGSPTAPAGPPVLPAVPPGRVLSLQPGSYALDLIGFGISADPVFPPCNPPALQGGRTAAWIPVSLARESDDWVARTSLSAGTLELRFHQTGDSIRGVTVSGSISGNAADEWTSRPIVDRGRVFLLGPGNGTVVQGVADMFSPFLSGTVSGDIRFTNHDATAVSRCTVVMWILQPMSDVTSARASEATLHRARWSSLRRQAPSGRSPSGSLPDTSDVPESSPTIPDSHF